MRIGIFGGSFDPPHVGHLLAATDAIEALELNQLQVVPASTQPLKLSRRTAAHHRLAMTRSCFGGVPLADVDAIEIERGGLSFTVDTVENYRRRWPAAELHLLLGEDAVASIDKWHEPGRLLSMVQLVVLARSGGSATHTEFADINASAFLNGQPAPIRLATRRVDVSSTEIRARVGSGRSIRGFVSDAVAAYIASTGLYLPESETPAGPTPA